MKPGRANRFVWFAAELAIGVTVAVCFIVLTNTSAGGRGIGLLVSFGVLLATIVLHEAGHVAASLAIGCRVISGGIGPIVFERRRRGFRMHFRKTRYSGFVLSIPDFRRDVRKQFFVVVAGGPAANFIAAIVLFAVLPTVPGSYFGADKAIVWTAALLNVVMGVANLLPYVAAGASDGMRLLRWLRKDQAHSDDLQLLRYFDESLNGRLASEYSRDEIESFEASGNLTLSMVGSYLALCAAQQRHDRSAFDAVFERVRGRVEALDKPTYASVRNFWVMFLLEDAFERTRAGDPAAVERFMAEYGSLARSQRNRLEAARHLALNDVERASRSIERERKEVGGSYHIATRRAGTLIVDELGDELERRRHASVAQTA